MSVGSIIKSIQDIMRKDSGVDGDAQRISQIVWMIFLKILDDKEKEKELMDDKFKSSIPKNLRWRNWASDPEGITGEELLKFVDNDLFPNLKNLKIKSQEDKIAIIVRSIFEDAYNYMKNGTLIRQVLNKINDIDFNNSKDKHLFNDIYEKILKDLQSAGNAGEFYTPRAVTQFMVDMVDPKIGEKILDPACGTGGFLVSSINNLRDKYVKSVEDEEKLQESIFGVEKKSLPHLLSVTNMLLHGIDEPFQIRHDNTLSKPLINYKLEDRVDVVVTNPPFGGMEEDGIESNFPKNLQTRETADLFLILIMHVLKKYGRAAIVLPDGTLFGEGVKTRIKEKLLTECNLHTIVRLPNGVFNPYTGIKTNLLFFTKGKKTKDIWYYEHPYPEGVTSYNKTKPMRIEEFEPEKEWWGNEKDGFKSRSTSKYAWKVSVEEVIKNNYNLDIKNPHIEETEKLDPEELLADYEKQQNEIRKLQNELKKILGDALKNNSSGTK